MLLYVYMDKDIISALGAFDDNPHATMLEDNTLSQVSKWIDTGSYSLNAILSGKIKDGGIPCGRITTFYAESQTGKSLFLQKIIANAQKQGMVAVILDSENAIEKSGAEKLGVDPKLTKYVPVTTVEECRNSLHKFLSSVYEKNLHGRFIVAIDSLANLSSELDISRLEKNSTAVDMGGKARALRTLLVNTTHLAAKTGTPIIATNHLYDDPTALHPTLVKKMSGGKSIEYLSSIVLQMSRKATKEDTSKDDKVAVGQRNYVGILIRALTTKNRFLKQYLEGETYISYDRGVDRYHGLLDLAVGFEIIQQNGPTYTFDGEKIGYAKNFVRDIKFWEDKIIPKLQDKIDVAWKLGTVSQEDEEAFLTNMYDK
jgi:RecA/RadA recombinase